MDLLAAVLAIPPQAIQTTFRSGLLNDNADGIREPHGIMRCIRRQQEQLSLIDVNVLELALLHRLQQHATFVLVEELGRLVDVVVGASVGAADNHNRHRIMVDAVVIDGRFQQVRVFFQPASHCQRHAFLWKEMYEREEPYHLGKFRGEARVAFRDELEKARRCSGTFVLRAVNEAAIALLRRACRLLFRIGRSACMVCLFGEIKMFQMFSKYCCLVYVSTCPAYVYIELK